MRRQDSQQIFSRRKFLCVGGSAIALPHLVSTQDRSHSLKKNEYEPPKE